MNIKPIETTTVKQSIVKRMQNAFNKRFTNLKELVCDVFEKNTGEKFYIHEGKKLRCHSSRFRARELPNCVSGPGDYDGITVKKIVLDPEDVKRLEQLTHEEYIEERWKLIKAGKYREEDW